jgi:hypothetical protein
MIQLTYFFNPNYFNELVKLNNLRSIFYFYNFLLILIFIFLPIYYFINVLKYLRYKTVFVRYFLKSYVYGNFYGFGFEEVYDDALTELVYEKQRSQHYEF